MLYEERFSCQGIIDAAIGYEKGYVNDANDSGGRTRWGITENLAIKYKHLWAEHGFNGNMRELPVELARVIYKLEFWNRMRLDQVALISPLLTDKLFDWGINTGSKYPIQALQRHLNASNRMATDYNDLVADGVIGRVTLNALETYIKVRGRNGVEWALELLGSYQTMNYMDLVERREKDESFYSGWLDRVDSHRAKYREAFKAKKHLASDYNW